MDRGAGRVRAEIVAPADRLVKLPDGLTFKDGAAAMLQGMTAHYLIASTYPLKKGDVCLIQAAAGGVGLLLCQMAKMRGPPSSAPSPPRRRPRSPRRRPTTSSSTPSRTSSPRSSASPMASACTWSTTAWADHVRQGDQLSAAARSHGAVRSGERARAAARSADPERAGLPVRDAAEPQPPHRGREELLERAGDVLGWIRDGKVKLRLEHQFPLAEAAEAHRALEGRKTTGKILLIPAWPVWRGPDRAAPPTLPYAGADHAEVAAHRGGPARRARGGRDGRAALAPRYPCRASPGRSGGRVMPWVDRCASPRSRSPHCRFRPSDSRICEWPRTRPSAPIPS